MKKSTLPVILLSGFGAILVMSWFSPFPPLVRSQQTIDCSNEQSQTADNKVFELRDRAQQNANAGKIEEAVEPLSQAFRLMQRLPNNANKATVFGELVNGSQAQPGLVEQIITQSVATGKSEKASDLLSSALQVAQGLDGSYSFVKTRSLAAIARLYADIGQRDRASTIISQSVQAEKGIRGAEFKTKALTEIARAYIAIAQVGQASQILSESLRQAQSVNYPNAFRKAWVLQPIAVNYAKLGEFEKAIEIAREIADNYYQSETLAEIAIAYARQGKLESALEIAEAIKLADKKASALAEIAAEAEKAGASDKISEILTRALQVAKTIEDTQVQSGAISKIALEYAKAGQPDTALSIIEPINIAEIKAIALGKIAVQYAEIGQREKASQIAARSLETVKAIPENYQQAYVLQGMIQDYLKFQLYDSAIQAVKQIGYYDQQSTVLQEIARDAVKNGQYDIALKAAEVIPSNVVTLAFEYQKVGQTERASALLDRALEKVNSLEIGAQKFELLAALALEYSKAGQQQKAEELFSQALAIARSEVVEGSYIWVTVFERYLQDGQYDLAFRIAKAMQDQSFQNTALKSLAKKYIEAGQEEAAFGVIDTFEKPQEKVGILLEMADKYIDVGQGDRTSKVLAKAFEIARTVPGSESQTIVVKVDMAPDGTIFSKTEVEDPFDRGSLYEEIAIKYARSRQYNQAVQVARTLEDAPTRDRLIQRLGCYR